MKRIYTLTVILFAALSLSAQSEKQVNWTFTAKKVSDKVYEVRMNASIQGDYHMYAQDVGVEGPLPTLFKIKKNPLTVLEGPVKEIGKVIKKKEEVWGGVVRYYENSVEFVQVVKLKGNIKTNVSGSVEFIVCDEKECLPPSEVPFKINIGG